ncbi:hypothetical protein D3C86_1776010 [compost metagenome]
MVGIRAQRHIQRQKRPIQWIEGGEAENLLLTLDRFNHHLGAPEHPHLQGCFLALKGCMLEG